MKTSPRVWHKRAAKPDLITPTAIIELKRNVSARREIGDVLIELAISLVHDSGKRGYLLLIDPRLREDRLALDIKDFQSTLLPDVAKRLIPVIAKKGKILSDLRGIRLEDAERLRHIVDGSVESGELLASPDKQAEVFFVLLWDWMNRITKSGPLTFRRLQTSVGCNYRTVSAAVDRLGPAVKRLSDRSIVLKYFPEQEWKRVLAVGNKVRSTIRFADASDQPRSPESLLKRLKRLHRGDIALGGVLGAKHHFPDLDIVGAPRLDLCLHVPESRVDLGFIRELDPALERTTDPHRYARLALYFLRRNDSLFDRDNEGVLWADPVECLLELCDARLEHQALAFQDYLMGLGGGWNGDI